MRKGLSEMPISKNSKPQLDDRDLKELQAFSIRRVVSKNNERGIRLSAICADVGLKTSTIHRKPAHVIRTGRLRVGEA